ncbi:PrsW family intramembrane metalloprotease [Pseudonocardia spinosispora]|uniref:PrsW family intramembrane metalloprotease n=1 Tax=Pseudonocardia spinosispora TaxID=103441 RepID=UPI00041543B1|nr:PrsW family intramembrane metalloprotease [Pseudonocardia spinosispora]
MSFMQPPAGPFGPPPGPLGGGALTATGQYRLRARRQRRGVLGTVFGLVLLGVCGLMVLGIIAFQVSTAGVIVGTLGALLPVGPVVAAFLWLDRWEPEPPRLLLIAFLWGACFATLAALVLNSSAEAATAAAIGDDNAGAFGAVFVAPWVEEAMKGAFLLGLVLFRRREFDGVLDGVVYAGLVAAGFAFTENILYLGQAFSSGAADGGQGGGVFAVLIMRGVFSPFAHPLFTAMTGIGLGLATNARNAFIRIGAPVGGYLFAVFLHALWNASASLGDGTALAAVYLMVMLPIFVFVVFLVLYQRRREQRITAAELPGMAEAGWIAPSEVRLLESLAGRSGWLRAVRRRSGANVAKMVAEYQAAVTELAILRHRMARGSLGPHAREWHDELLEDVLVSRARAVGSPDALHAAWGRRTPPPGWSPPPPGPVGPRHAAPPHAGQHRPADHHLRGAPPAPGQRMPPGQEQQFPPRQAQTPYPPRQQGPPPQGRPPYPGQPPVPPPRQGPQ